MSINKIKSLYIEKMGRFHRREFELGPATLFYGPNEAGKSTIYDAMLRLFSSISGTTRLGRSMNERYGEMAVELRNDNGKTIDLATLPTEELLNLYALHAPGKLELEIKSGGGRSNSWANSLRTQLLEGGVGTDAIRKNLESYRQRKLNTSRGKEIAQLEQDLGQLQRDREKLQSQLNELHRREAERLDATATLGPKREELASLREQIAGLDQKLQRDQASRRSRELRRELTLFIEIDSLERELAALQGYTPEREEALKREHEARRKRENERSLARQRIELAVSQLAEREEASRQRSSQLEASSARRSLANDLLSRIEAWKKPLRRERRPLPGQRRAAAFSALIGAGALLASAITAILASPIMVTLLLFVIALAAAGLAWHLFRGASEEIELPDDEAEERFCQSLEREWRQGGSDKSDSAGQPSGWAGRALPTTPTGWRDLLEHYLAELRRSEQSLSEERNRIEAERAALASEREKLNDSEQTAATETPLADLADFISKRSERDTRLAEREQQRAHLAKLIERERVATAAELETELKRRVDQEMERGGDSEPLRDAERQQLDRERSDKRAQLEELQRSLNSAEQSAARSEGELSAQMAELPGRLLKVDESVFRVRERLAELELEESGAALALELLGELDDDTSLQFQELSESVVIRGKTLFGGERAVEIGELESKSIRLADAGGELRAIDHLSSGTRDLVHFALRLELASRAADGSGRPLLLDDPLLFLDAKRQRRALEYLRLFQREWPGSEGCSIYLFTKEEGIAKMAEEVFSDLVRHDL